MKTKNFPARKLRRQLLAANEDIISEINIALLDRARDVKTKKNRTKTK